jgi:lactate dehydrogenase-like 2-hydroxyacid dehydrogenase
VDVSYCTSKSILVANVPLANAVSVAEHTLFLILYLAKNVKEKSSANNSNSNNNDNSNNCRSGLLFERRIPGVLVLKYKEKYLLLLVLEQQVWKLQSEQNLLVCMLLR